MSNEFSDVFISYARPERLHAEIIAHHLSEKNFRVWWDYNLIPGDDFSEEIEKMIRGSGCTIVLWSKLAAESKFVRSEARLSQKLGKYIPISLDGTMPPVGLDQEHVEIINQFGLSASAYLDNILPAIRKKKNMEPTGRCRKLDIGSIETALWSYIRKSNRKQDYQNYIDLFGEDGAFHSIAVKEALIEDTLPIPTTRKFDTPSLAEIVSRSKSKGVHKSTLKMIDRLYGMTLEKKIAWRSDQMHDEPILLYQTEGYSVFILKNLRILVLSTPENRMIEVFHAEQIENLDLIPEYEHKIRWIIDMGASDAQ